MGRVLYWEDGRCWREVPDVDTLTGAGQHAAAAVGRYLQAAQFQNWKGFMLFLSFLSGVAFTIVIELIGLHALLEPLRGTISFVLDVLSLVQAVSPN